MGLFMAKYLLSKTTFNLILYSYMRRLLYKIQIPMLLFLPFWFTLGRCLIAGCGYGIITTLFFSALLFAGLAVIYHYTTRMRSDVAQTKKLPVADTIFLLTIYISSFLYGFFFEDAIDGDGYQKFMSVATKISEISHPLANQLATIMLWVFLVSEVAYILYCKAKIKKQALENNKK